MNTAWQARLDRAIGDLEPKMRAVRRRLHERPELSGAEFETTRLLLDELRQAGFESRCGPGSLGVLADSPPAADGIRRVALRADIDALHIHDGKDAAYCSRNDGVMHACGHDAHAAIGLGAMLALRAMQEEGSLPWPLAWRGVFQPSEETAEGALEMIEAGALEGVRAIFALHVDPSRRVGSIGVRNGALTASCDWLEIRLRGRGGHAARPHESLDPIAAAAQLISAIYSFIPRGADTHEPVVVTIGEILGGDNPNVIPEETVLRGTLRTLDEDARESTKDHLRKLARGMAEASDVQIEVAFRGGLSAVRNDPRVTDVLRAVGAAALGAENVEEIDRPSMGGEDFSGYLQHVPGAMFRLGVRSETIGGEPLHSPMFDIDESALGVGARVLAQALVLAARPDEGDSSGVKGKSLAGIRRGG